MKVDDVLRCSFSSWYPAFKEVTMKTTIIPLPAEFVEYLLADGIVLPEGSLVQQASSGRAEEDSVDAGDDTDWETDTAEAPTFPEFEAKVKETIKDLGGKVFPKLNWSAPRDASWMSFDRTLKCVCPGDIYLLLKSSDFITHDLTEPFSQCDDFSSEETPGVNYELVLRKWHDLNTGMEFRCFVHKKKLLAVSQRDCSQYFDFLPSMKEEIISGIQAFLFHVIADKFPCSEFVFDVYMQQNDTFLVVDFNPFGSVTDPLMFTWAELNSRAYVTTDLPVTPEFRCLDGQTGIKSTDYASNAVPREVSDATDPEDFDRLLGLLQSLPQQDSDTESGSSNGLDVSESLD